MTAYPIPDVALAKHIASVGMTGSGKTSTSKLMIERVVAGGFRVCILDPIKSDWWGITSSADGKSPGLPFRILGGPRGHVPLHASAGAVIGQLVGQGKLPLSIIDMADFEPGGLQKFFNDFAPALLRHARGVLYLVVEEAHEFAPKERSGIGAETHAIHWAKKLATAGRSKGIRLIVATQRVQSLHNAVLGSCETLIAHRLRLPADQEPVRKWLGANVDKDSKTQVEETLASLPTGTGWLCSGEAQLFERVDFPKFWTYDNTATPTADSEEVAVKTAPVDHDELRDLIGDAVKEAEATDPKLLRAEIAELRRKLAAAEKGGAPSWPDQRAEVAALKQQRDALATAIRNMNDAFNGIWERFNVPIARMQEAQNACYGTLHHLDTQIPAPAGDTRPNAPAGSSRKPAPPSPSRISRPAVSSAGEASSPSGGGASIPPGTRPALSALASVYPAGMTRGQIAARVGIKKKGSTFSAYMSRLRTAGLIEEREGLIFASELGASSVGEVEPLPQPGPDLARSWARKLPGTGPIVESLLASHPAWRERAEIADEMNINPGGSTLSAYISRLSTAGVIEKSGQSIRLSAEVMGNG